MIHYIFSVENKSYLQAEENLTNICSANNPGERLLQELRMENIAYVLHSAFDQAADSLFPLNFSNGKVKLFFLAIPVWKCAHRKSKVAGFRGGIGMSISTPKTFIVPKR